MNNIQTPKLAFLLSNRVRSLVLMTALLLSAAGAIFAQRTDGPPPPKVAPSASEIAQSGKLDGSTYRNKLLQISLVVPERWNFTSEEMNKALLADGNAKIKANETKARQEAFDRSLANSSVLFMLSKHSFMDPANTANLASGFERTSNTVQAYTEFNKTLVLSKTANSRLVNDIRSVQLGGKSFLSFDVEGTVNEVLVRQTYYVMSWKGGMLFFVLSWIKEADERKRLEDVVRSIKFDS